MTTILVGEDVRTFVMPTMHAHSLGRFGDDLDEENKGDAIGWEISCLMDVGRSTLGHYGDM